MISKKDLFTRRQYDRERLINSIRKCPNDYSTNPDEYLEYSTLVSDSILMQYRSGEYYCSLIRPKDVNFGIFKQHEPWFKLPDKFVTSVIAHKLIVQAIISDLLDAKYRVIEEEKDGDGVRQYRIWWGS